MFTTQQILTWLISVGGVGLMWFLNRNKQAAETRKLVAEETAIIVREYKDLLDTHTQKRAVLNAEIKELREEVREQREEMNELKKENAECELRNNALGLEISVIKRQVDMQEWVKETLFVLDDNAMVLMDFKQRFKAVSVIDCRVYNSHELFLLAAREEKPEVVVMDHYLTNEITAEDVLDQLGYEPEIFIMSHDKTVQLKFQERGIRFFYKDDYYVQKITKAVIEHLKDKY